jgi:hypothetical protein
MKLSGARFALVCRSELGCDRVSLTGGSPRDAHTRANVYELRARGPADGSRWLLEVDERGRNVGGFYRQ